MDGMSLVAALATAAGRGGWGSHTGVTMATLHSSVLLAYCVLILFPRKRTIKYAFFFCVCVVFCWIAVNLQRILELDL